MGVRFSSHGGGKELGSEWVRERERDWSKWKRKRRKDCRTAAFSCFLWKRPCSVCVLYCPTLPLAKSTKASIYLPWVSSLIEKRPCEAGGHHMCQGDMAFPLLTLQSQTWSAPNTTSTRATNREKRKKKKERERKWCICSTYLHFFSWHHNAPLDLMESEHFHSGMRNPPHQWSLFPHSGFFSRSNSTSQNTICQLRGRRGHFIRDSQ